MKGLLARHNTFTQLCCLGCILLGNTFLAAVAATLVSRYGAGRIEPAMNLRLMLLIQNSILFLGTPILAQHLFQDRALADAFSLRRPSCNRILIGCVAILSSGPVIDALNTWNQSLRLPTCMHAIEQWMIASEAQAEQITAQMLGIHTWTELGVNLILIAALAGVGEELLFRGTLQPILQRATGNRHWGIWITAFLFSAIHLQFFGFVPRMVLGALLGYLYLYTRSLWVPIAAHTFNNAWVVIFTPSAFNEKCRLIQHVAGMDNNPWFVVGSLLTSGLCIYWLYKRQLPSSC